MAFGYPLRAADGTLRAVLFATITVTWFDRLIEGFRLPEGWEASVVSDRACAGTQARARALARSQGLRGHHGEHGCARGGRGRRIAEFTGPDGVRRRTASASRIRCSGFLAIGAPLERSLEAVGQRLLLHLALIAGIAWVFALIARFYIYRLIEVWAARIRAAIADIAAGRRDARIGRATGVVSSMRSQRASSAWRWRSASARASCSACRW